MRFWRRRSPGKHALGAAVTGIPSAVPRPAAASVGGAVVVPPPRVQAPPARGEVFVPSVQLGFRDGTYATLDPSSAHSRALHALARAMTSCE